MYKSCSRFLGLLQAIVISSSLYGLNAWAETTPPPPCSDPAYHDFDFLIGAWLVHSPEGQLQGENTISVEENGCLLVEHWRGVQGGTGQSYNYYQPATGQWRQLWVSQHAIVDYQGGSDEPGTMHLDGDIVYQVDGRRAKFTGTWTAQADGSVRQELKQWDADKNIWLDWFTGVYTAKTIN